ncbi:MAG: adenosylmethionine decarboxylase [Myxococcota bacterium]
MDTRGQHLLAEYHGCRTSLLNDKDIIQRLLTRAAEDAGATVVAAVFHRFSPQGISGVVVIEESHLSIHTWPEAGYAAVDFYTCGDCHPELAHRRLMEGLQPERAELLTVVRGMGWERSIRVSDHQFDGAWMPQASNEG